MPSTSFVDTSNQPVITKSMITKSLFHRFCSFSRFSRRAKVRHASSRRLQPESLETRYYLTGTTMLLADIHPDDSSSPEEFVQLGSIGIFVADDGVHGVELWKTDGTTEGTQLLKDITPGEYGSYPAQLTEVNGTVFFTAGDNPNNYELWRTDGTTAGTVQVKDLTGSPDSGSYPNYLTAWNGRVFFSADDGTHGAQLWASNGTDAGTVPLFDPEAAPELGEFPRELTPGTNQMFFVAFDENFNDVLWRTDGTAAGTRLVKNITPAAYIGSTGNNMATLGDTLFFVEIDGIAGSRLWSSDGTETGTAVVKAIESNPAYAIPAAYFTAMSGNVFFSATSGEFGRELWKTDGTSSGTMMVKDIFPGTYQGSYPRQLTVMDNQLFFAASSEEHGEELWKSDGTAEGTVQVKDIDDSPYIGSSPYYLTAHQGTLYFTATHPDYGRELWQTDGTPEGTALAGDIHRGASDTLFDGLFPFGDQLLLSYYDEAYGTELFEYDPHGVTPTGSAFDFDFTVIASDLHSTFRFFNSPNPDHAPFTKIRFGHIELTSLLGFPATNSLISAPGDITVAFGSDQATTPVSVVSLAEFDSGFGDGVANQIYRPTSADVPEIVISLAGEPVARGTLQEISLETRIDFSVISVVSRFQVLAPIGDDTTVFDELMAVTNNTGIVPFSLSAFHLVGPWAGVGDAEIFQSTGSSLFDSLPQIATDYDQDGLTNTDDLDQLTHAVFTASSDRRFDLDRNGMVDAADVAAWLDLAAQVNLPSGQVYLPADVNLDGVVDSVDLASWELNAFTFSDRWSAGDLNQDGAVDARDFNRWLEYRFQGFVSESPAAASVPRAPRAAGSGSPTVGGLTRSVAHPTTAPVPSDLIVARAPQAAVPKSPSLSLIHIVTDQPVQHSEVVRPNRPTRWGILSDVADELRIARRQGRPQVASPDAIPLLDQVLALRISF